MSSVEDKQQVEEEETEPQAMPTTVVSNDESSNTTSRETVVKLGTIDTGFERENAQDSKGTGSSCSLDLAERLQQMTVSPERKRDETPPAERVVDAIFAKQDSDSRLQTESPTVDVTSFVTGPHDTPNSYTRYLHRETPPKRRSPATMLRAAPTRHFDLTPVTRNTSNDAYMDDYSDEEDYFVITPDDTAGVLHGEHLALPSDLSPEVSFCIPGVANIHKQLPERRAAGPPLPPLRACPKQRTKSVGTLDSVIQTACYQTQMEDATGVEHFDSCNEVMHPIDFPERQVYSFTSRQQFEQQQHRKQLTPEMMVASSSVVSTRGLTPYQPSREDFQDVGTLPEEELRHIFATREKLNEFVAIPETNNSALYAAIPLDERQWSIPSIRLAHHLNESTTSNTDCTDEEDDLRLDEDEESLTSRGSSLFLPDEAALAGDLESGLRHAPPRIVPLLPNSFQPILSGPAISVLENGQFLEHLRQHQEEDADGSNDAVEDRATRHRRKKRSKKERRAVEWLRTVEASDDVFAEAASSKFLTGASLPFRSCGTSQMLTTSNSPACRRNSPPNEDAAPPAVLKSPFDDSPSSSATPWQLNSRAESN